MYYLEANHIVKQYASHRALDNVTVHVPENGIYGLLGPNGAGKTTLIRIINQITAPDEGEVLINGRPLHPSDVEHIGYLPEERGLYKKMKVGEQILYLAQLKGLSKNAAKEGMKYWLNKFDIKGWEKKKIEELSKGMQQKIQFITTVMHNPKLLIFDEPFSGRPRQCQSVETRNSRNERQRRYDHILYPQYGICRRALRRDQPHQSLACRLTRRNKQYSRTAQKTSLQNRSTTRESAKQRSI